MLLEIVLFTVGVGILYFGAEWLVKGSASMAMTLGMSPMAVGLTVVAFGTSMPELVVSLTAVIKNASDVALGNVIGSNIANIGLVMAVGALFYPLAILRGTINRELPYMVGVTLLLMALCVDGEISRVDGLILIAVLLVFTGYCLYGVGKDKEEAEAVAGEVEDIAVEGESLRRNFGVTVAGIIGVIIGAYVMIESATKMARDLGITEFVIGVTVVAVGTSLPELATTAIAAMRKHTDIAVGNIIGSNIFNIGLVLGATATARPLEVSWEVLTTDMVIMCAFSLALIPFSMKLMVGRVAGATLLTGYALFVYTAFL